MRGWTLAVGITLAACAAPPNTGEVAPAVNTGSSGSRTQEELVPGGFGTLRQDDFTVALRADALLLKVTPLTERVIRLAAPDTYQRLRQLAASRSGDLSSAVRSPELFLVSFFSYEPDVAFQPEDLELVHQGRYRRAAQVLPLTPGWGSPRLGQQETQSAIYVFEGPFDYELPITLSYGMARSEEWNRIVPRLQAEEGKVRARAGG